MAYFTRAELEEYRRHNMSGEPAAEFLTRKGLDPRAYADEHVSTAVEKNGSPEGDLDRLELKLAEVAKDRHYEFLTNVTPSHGQSIHSVSARGFIKR